MARRIKQQKRKKNTLPLGMTPKQVTYSALGFVVGCWLIAGWFLEWHQLFYAQVSESTINASKKYGLVLEDIYVEGRNRTSRNDLLYRLKVKEGDPLFSLNPEEVRARIEGLSWVRSAMVERRFPKSVYIKLSERTPFARYQLNKKVYLMDEGGTLIYGVDIEPYGELPLVIGAKSLQHFPAFYKELKTYKALRDKIKVFIFYGERRWDLKLKNGLEVKLPQENVMEAIEKLVLLDKKYNILNKDILTLDMRVPEQISVGVSKKVNNFLQLKQQSGAQT